MEYLTQLQAEELCRILRMEHDAEVQEAYNVYKKTIDSLRNQYTEAIESMDKTILEYKRDIAKEKEAMSTEWNRVFMESKQKGEALPAMGVVVAPFKKRINDLSFRLLEAQNERGYMKERYEHNCFVARDVKESACREAKERYHADRMKVMEQVVTKQPDYWRQKYEELKKQMEGAA